MATPAKARQARELLVASGDAWAWCIDRYHARRRAGRPAANSNTQIWPDLRAHGPFGPLSVRAAQDVAKAWSAAFFESVRRRKAGEKAALPLSKHYERPVTWRHGDFQFVPAGVASRPRVSLQRARYHPRLVLAFSHPVPYPPESVRAVKLLVDGGELFLDVTSWVAISATRRVSGRIAGADPGIIHPLVLAAGPEALMISGRAVRSEEYLHLADTKARQAKQARRREPVKAQPGSPRQAGSRRWRSLGAKQRRAEARSRRRVRLAANRSARIAASWATDHQGEKVRARRPRGHRAEQSWGGPESPSRPLAACLHPRRASLPTRRRSHQPGSCRRTRYQQPLPSMRPIGRQERTQAPVSQPSLCARPPSRRCRRAEHLPPCGSCGGNHRSC